ncbi:MAG: hypothetical protein O2904_01710 [bacterium]|nr:hypothetical protein [bacterium]
MVVASELSSSIRELPESIIDPPPSRHQSLRDVAELLPQSDQGDDLLNEDWSSIKDRFNGYGRLAATSVKKPAFFDATLGLESLAQKSVPDTFRDIPVPQVAEIEEAFPNEKPVPDPRTFEDRFGDPDARVTADELREHVKQSERPDSVELAIKSGGGEQRTYIKLGPNSWVELKKEVGGFLRDLDVDVAVEKVDGVPRLHLIIGPKTVDTLKELGVPDIPKSELGEPGPPPGEGEVPAPVDEAPTPKPATAAAEKLIPLELERIE